MSPANRTLRQIGKYQITRPIGSGSMSTVYRGHDPFSGRDVAIKILSEKADADPDTTQHRLFFNEAKAAGVLKHPNIAAILDAGESDQLYYLVMEYVPGERTLEDFTSSNSLLPLETAIKVLFQCAMAMDYAHGKGVVHRDLKPSNVLLTRELDAKITDFGIASLGGHLDEGLLEHHGSPLYMSPEQLRGEPAGASSDIFTLGLITFEMIAGRHPFSGRSLKAIQEQMLNADPPPLSSLRKDVPAVLDRVVTRALARDPAARYRTAVDLAGDLSVVFDFVDAEALSRAQKFAAAKELPQFRGLADAELWELIAISSWIRLGAGETLYARDHVDKVLYVVIEGALAVAAGDHHLGDLGKGDCYGARGHAGLALKLTAASDATLLKVPVAVLERTSQSCQLQFTKLFLHALIERLERTGIALVERR